MSNLLLGAGLYFIGQQFYNNNNNNNSIKKNINNQNNQNNKNNIKEKNIKEQNIEEQIKLLEHTNNKLKNKIKYRNNKNRETNKSINFLEDNNLFEHDKNQQNLIDSQFDIDIMTDKFEHNNMVHFYGGKVTQNIENSQQRKLDMFTGNEEKIKKEEIIKEEPSNKENIYGFQNNNNFFQSRIVESDYISNELPFEQIKVGPGLGLDKNIPAQGNYHPDIREYELPKTVDELRTNNNPKKSYVGRLLSGKKEIIQQANYNFVKFRDDPMFINRPLEKGKSYLPSDVNTGPRPEITSTNNRKDSRIVEGHAKSYIEELPNYLNIQDDKKNILKSDGNRNIINNNKYELNKDDYIFDETKKENISQIAFNKNLYTGNILEALIPTQHYFDKARKTNKETTENNTKDILNLSSNKKEQLYNLDPTRKTIKETTIDNNKDIMNLKGGRKEQLYNLEPARKTIKETTINNIKDILNLKVYTKLPEDIKLVIKKTLKETLLNTPRLGNVIIKKDTDCEEENNISIESLKKELKITLKEILIKDSQLLNLFSNCKHKKYFDDIAKITHKQTYSDKNQIGIADIKLNEGYKIVNYDMKDTNKQELHKDYMGIINKENKDGYLSNKYEAPDTERQKYVDNDYYGNILGNKETMSYEDIYNATINDVKEKTLESREPTQNNVKISNGSDTVNLDIKCELLKKDPDILRLNKIENKIPDTENNDFNKLTNTKSISIDDVKEFNEKREISDIIKDQLDDNPFKIDLLDDPNLFNKELHSYNNNESEKSDNNQIEKKSYYETMTEYYD